MARSGRIEEREALLRCVCSAGSCISLALALVLSLSLSRSLEVERTQGITIGSVDGRRSERSYGGSCVSMFVKA